MCDRVNMADRDREKGAPRSRAAAISFTFDDGCLSTYTHAFPLLRKAGMVGHIAIITDVVGKPGHYSWEQIDEMAAAGWEIESHSCTHSLDDVSMDNLRREVVESKRTLENHGLQVGIFNFPGGPWQDAPVFLPDGPFEQLIRQHYAGYLPIHNRMPHPMRPPVDPYRLSWQCGECFGYDDLPSLDVILKSIDHAVAEDAWYNSLWHDVMTNEGKHWPKFQRVVEYAAEHIRAGRLRCVTSMEHPGLNQKST